MNAKCEVNGSGVGGRMCMEGARGSTSQARKRKGEREKKKVGLLIHMSGI
jgi:hypothetical protein